MAATQAARLSAADGLACSPCVGPNMKCGSVYMELDESRCCSSLFCSAINNQALVQAGRHLQESCIQSIGAAMCGTHSHAQQG